MKTCRLTGIESFIARRSRMMHVLGGIPEFILENQEVLDYYTELTICDFEILKTYTPIVAGPGKELKYGVIFYGCDDIIIDPAKIHLWIKDIKTICAEIAYPGNHFYINERFFDVSKEIDNWSSKIHDILRTEVITKK